MVTVVTTRKMRKDVGATRIIRVLQKCNDRHFGVDGFKIGQKAGKRNPRTGKKKLGEVEGERFFGGVTMESGTRQKRG